MNQAKPVSLFIHLTVVWHTIVNLFIKKKKHHHTHASRLEWEAA